MQYYKRCRVSNSEGFNDVEASGTDAHSDLGSDYEVEMNDE